MSGKRKRSVRASSRSSEIGSPARFAAMHATDPEHALAGSAAQPSVTATSRRGAPPGGAKMKLTTAAPAAGSAVASAAQSPLRLTVTQSPGRANGLSTAPTAPRNARTAGGMT
ncbi:MAG: hypothetical protein ACREJT_15285, partial [Myxococcota bacterium]